MSKTIVLNNIDHPRDIFISKKIQIRQITISKQVGIKKDHMLKYLSQKNAALMIMPALLNTASSISWLYKSPNTRLQNKVSCKNDRNERLGSKIKIYLCKQNDSKSER